MIRLSDSLFISTEPDYDTVIAIRIKNGEYYFRWMENADSYKYVMAKHPEENLLDRDCFSDANSLYHNIISCDDTTMHICQLRLKIHILIFLSNIKCYERNAMSDADDHDIFSLTWMKSIPSVMH